MIGMSKGIAHVSFPGGGFFLPARSTQDRQMLVQQVTDRLRTSGHVQVLVDDRRWLVRCEPGWSCCRRCGGALPLACYSAADGAAPLCLWCTFGDAAETAAPHPAKERMAG